MSSIMNGALALVGLISLTSWSTAGKAAETANPRKLSDAENALSEFDRAHPKCQIWTNWQKMCSRTGPSGETICIRDPDRKAAPSAPFCTGSSLGYEATGLSPRQEKSVLRFCESYSEMEIPEIRNGSRMMKPLKLCQRFRANRPFNGRRIAARLHPWCSQWSDSGTGAVVCNAASEASDETPNCRTLADEAYAHENRLYCSRWNLPKWCREARSFYELGESETGWAPHEQRSQTGDVIYFGDHPPTPAPVFGVQCEMTQETFDHLQE